MTYQLPDIRTVNLLIKRVLVRADLDAPVADANGQKQVTDDTRLMASLPTLDYLFSRGAVVIMVGHLRRPEKIDPNFSLTPIAQWFYQKLSNNSSEFVLEKVKMNEFHGWKLHDRIFLLENIRFFQEESKNDPEFAKKLASLAELYVNDAFASSHREQASIVGVPKLLPHFAGLRLQKEIETLSQVTQNPKRPLAVLIGGAKIETKLPIVERMHQFADFVLVGGKIAQETESLLKVQHEQTPPLPDGKKSELIIAKLNSQGTDITLESVEQFQQVIRQCQTIIWNGPMGYIEDPTGNGAKGTEAIAKAVLESKAFSVVGGGDSLGFLKRLGLLSEFGFYSTGGGAMLAFLSGQKLPGLEALAK